MVASFAKIFNIWNTTECVGHCIILTVLKSPALVLCCGDN